MARFSGWGAAMAVAVAAVTQVMWAQADTVKGVATVGTAKINLTSGMAVSYTSPIGPLISVVLSDKPADPKEFAADTRTGAGEPLVAGTFEGAWKSQHIGKKLSGFTVSFNSKTTTIISEEFLFGGKNNTFSIGGSEYVLEVKSTSPRLVGRIRTTTPIVDAGSVKAGLDATFDLSVTPRK
jgi:hypothetical protein